MFKTYLPNFDFLFKNITGTPHEELLAIKERFFRSCCASREHFIVELQKARQDFFKDRSVFYASFPIQEMAQKRVWDFKLFPVFTIGILNFTFKDHQ